MKKIIFSLCLVVVFVISIVSIPKVYAANVDIDYIWFDNFLLVDDNPSSKDIYYFVSEKFLIANENNDLTLYDFLNGWPLNQCYFYPFKLANLELLKTTNPDLFQKILIKSNYYYLINLRYYADIADYPGSLQANGLFAIVPRGANYNPYNVNGIITTNLNTYAVGGTKGITYTQALSIDNDLFNLYYVAGYNDGVLDDGLSSEAYLVGYRQGIFAAYYEGFTAQRYLEDINLTDEGSYSYVKGNEIGQSTGFNGFTLILGFIFSALGAFGNIEIIPGLKLWYIVGITIVFGLIGFITSKGKKG